MSMRRSPSSVGKPLGMAYLAQVPGASPSRTAPSMVRVTAWRYDSRRDGPSWGMCVPVAAMRTRVLMAPAMGGRRIWVAMRSPWSSNVLQRAIPRRFRGFILAVDGNWLGLAPALRIGNVEEQLGPQLLVCVVDRILLASPGFVVCRKFRPFRNDHAERLDDDLRNVQAILCQCARSEEHTSEL